VYAYNRGTKKDGSSHRTSVAVTNFPIEILYATTAISTSF